jgi:tRNA (cmo5U34)-methyltransferase
MSDNVMSNVQDHFSDPETLARYTDGPPRFVPGFHDMQRMAALLIAERVADDARILVLGAGGGLELRTFAQAYPGWRFDGVDPSSEMLKLAEQTLGSLAPRAHLHEGYIDVAPEGPFDAATCLLTLHFLAREERLRTLIEIRRRLAPGAPFVAVHSSFPQTQTRGLWLSRYAAFAMDSGADPDKVKNFRAAVEAHLNLLSSDEDEELLREAGFSDVSLFYAAFTWRGWVAYA